MTSTRIRHMTIRGFAFFVVVGCGAVSSNETDAGIGKDAPSIDTSVDAAWTTNSVWKATDGLPDASCAPWTLKNGSTPEVPLLADGTLALTNDAASESLYYEQGAAMLTPVTTFIVDARLRFVSGISTSAARSHLAILLTMGGKETDFFLEDGAIFLNSGESTRGPATNVATSDAFHDYRIEMHVPSGGISISQDGTLVLTGTAYATSASDGIAFGDATGVAYGTSEWRRLSHNAHVLGPCP